MAKVIALYVAKNSRVSSPKFILGESYGGFRAAKVARTLQNNQGIVASGIIMVSPLLEGAFQFGGDRFALGAALKLPSLAAAELERNGTFTTAALAQAEHFALTDYLSALAGPPFPGDAAHAFYARVAQMTGLPEDVVARERGFIRDTYVKNLRAGDHKIVSQYDATFAVDDPHRNRQAGARARSVSRRLHPRLRQRLRRLRARRTRLQDRDDLQSAGLGHFRQMGLAGRPRSEQPSVAEDLRELLALTPSFHLMIAHGYSDMVTPFADSVTCSIIFR